MATRRRGERGTDAMQSLRHLARRPPSERATVGDLEHAS